MRADRLEHADDALISASEIASLAGVTRAAVSNWRRRYPDFPAPAGGGARNALFRAAEVRAWLEGQRKGREVSGEVLVWQALRAAYGGDVVRGLGDLGEFFATGEPGPLDGRVRAQAEERAAESSPADLLEGLTERFARSGGRVGSEYASTSRLACAIAHFAGPVEGTVFDPACGIGTLLLAFAGCPAVRLAGQEADAVAARFTRARTHLAGMPGTAIEVGDSLRDDRWPELRAELVVCDPPDHAADWGRAELLMDSRWDLGVPPRTETRLAWLQHCYAHTAPGGRVILVMPPSAAYRRAGRRIRAELVRRGILTEVVALPPGMAASHAQPVHLWLMTRPTGSRREISGVRMTDLTGHDPAGPFAPEDAETTSVAAVDLLDEDVDLSPARHVAVSHTDLPAEYAAARDALRSRLHGFGALVPPLAPGTGLPDGTAISVADLARAGLVDVEGEQVVSTSDRLDTAYLLGFLRSAANVRRSTSGSGTFRLDVRGSRVPQMGIDDQRLYGDAFRAIEDFERRVRELAELGERAAALAREGLTSGALQPVPDEDEETNG
ncbi:N-6 DNA methylase [Thermomonospora umbrina]|uniref:N-6 DNA methylase n=1 Tax=Thermomonospora umbrina TaxID=111806 RepID=A0A3D9SZ16_9ACTN|nr:N-6 DNA methylase [Thermomonospora umbrina]REE98215.1 N-6 DNA methylase [Thermomonospora umbrina]